MSAARNTRIFARARGAALAAAAAVLLTATARAQVMVQTIGGGVRSECGSTAGFRGGNTWTAAQFDYPYSSALDSQGNLWVADYGNSDVEEITQAGSRSTSLTFEYATGSNKHPFSHVMGVALDSSDNLYVLTPDELLVFESVTSSFPDLNPILEISLSSFSTSPASSLAVVNDAQTNIYISFAGMNSGSIVRIPQPYTGTYSQVVTNFPFLPAGMSMRQDAELAVTDTLRDGIYLVTTNGNSTPVLVTGGSGPGFVNGSSGFARFNTPRGIAASADGRMVVCDTMNNALRVIDAAFNTTTLYGTASNVWTASCCSCSPALYAGWVDGTAGTTTSNASGRLPVSVTISPTGALFVTEQYYNLIRAVTGSSLSPVITIHGGGGGTSTNAASLTTLSATGVTQSGATLNAVVDPNDSPATVFFQWGTNTSYGSNTASTVITTNLGGSNNVSFTLSGLPLGEVIHFQAVAINNGGTTYGGDRTFITGAAASSSNVIGFTYSPSAGAGATVYLPLNVQLVGGATLSSVQFRLEVAPVGTALPVTGLSLVQITSNDYVQLPGANASFTPVNYQLTPYNNTASANAAGLLVVASPGAGLSIQSGGNLGLITFQIPYNAATNQTYELNILYPSGSVADLSAANQILTIANLPYLAGDCYPASGYQAQEFGDGILEANDVNTIIAASMGIGTPPLYSDAFNAMDVSPQSAGINGVDGDGELRFQDWNEALLRSVALDPTNWIRSWTNGGNVAGTPYVNGIGLPGNPAFNSPLPAIRSKNAPPGMVWFSEAAIGADNVGAARPGATASVPVYATAQPGFSLSGFQFRAQLSSAGAAPAASGLSFAPAAGVPAPLALAGTSPNDLLLAWPLGAFSEPLQGSNYLGTLNFTVPSGAAAGNEYNIHFTAADASSPDNATSYALETFSGSVTVLAPRHGRQSLTSDEWKIHFFGSTTNVHAADAADPDHDGASNLEEYLAGTDPLSRNSVLKLNHPERGTNAAGEVTVQWLTAPGKTYVLEERGIAGGKWIPVSTNVGDGFVYQYTQNKFGGRAESFRIRLQP